MNRLLRPVSTRWENVALALTALVATAYTILLCLIPLQSPDLPLILSLLMLSALLFYYTAIRCITAARSSK